MTDEKMEIDPAIDVYNCLVNLLHQTYTMHGINKVEKTLELFEGTFAFLECQDLECRDSNWIKLHYTMTNKVIEFISMDLPADIKGRATILLERLRHTVQSSLISSPILFPCQITHTF